MFIIQISGYLCSDLQRKPHAYRLPFPKLFVSVDMQLSFCFTAGINRAGILTGLPEQLFAVLYPFCICIESVYRIIQSFKIVKFFVSTPFYFISHL